MIFIYFWVPWSWVGAFTFFIVLCWSDLFHFPSSTFPASRLFVLLFALHSEWFTGKACLLEHRTHDQKVPGSNPGRSGRRIFFSRVNFVCWLLFGVCSTPMLPQWHVKDSGHSAKSAGGRLHPKHAYTPDPSKFELADYAAVQEECGNISEN